ncbi:MAG: 3-hydroxylacyl-ACP dehydratase [Gammaproteobacteria bacterium]|nr:3-hydroxylacyl-ACP dehydratase [Gammaproteobacteria bacterium]NIM73087.1 3-hydroxylacyl-ACP dehydratase [Gammaproteobacteria bacterium]NIN38704.1 3-hydroxylacyl-ACP dehydratase [Gammaproteobacteria bacterium]NIO24840.1 3-hydroxylacyl-ACP dehydratase [Gammaproteobacteria bacterium]NIO65443.1 3-hydroxylacyl-ACP dehydratase [Gammaproteobacteria bacterium]
MPQAAGMCLLDGVRSWDATRVSCVSGSHRRTDHPLRHEGKLAAVHLLEYAAQATAVHGALAAGVGEAPVPVKYLVAARDFVLRVARIDDVQADLCIDAERLLVMGTRAIYAFRVTAEDRLLAEGRLSVAAPEALSP